MEFKDDATNPNIKERPMKSMLKCILTEEDKRTLADELANKQAELENLENEKKAVAKDYASRIELTQATISTSSNTYRQGWEVREVECSEIMDYERGEVRCVRLDTMETYKRRKMTQDELQYALPLDADGSSADKEAEKDAA